MLMKNLAIVIYPYNPLKMLKKDPFKCLIVVIYKNYVLDCQMI